MDRRPRWVMWLLVALVLVVLAAVLFWEMAPTASERRRPVARVLPDRAAMDLNHADGHTWAVLLTLLGRRSAALLLVGAQYGAG
jgi:hypothetical protein